MVSRFLDKRAPVLAGAGALAAPALGGLVARLLGGTPGAVLWLGGLCELAWVILVFSNRHRDPLWLGLTSSTIATVVLCLALLATALGCDDVNDGCAPDRGSELRFEVACFLMLAFAAIIVVRAAVRAIRRGRADRQPAPSR